jgi:signal transduction histidine kinase
MLEIMMSAILVSNRFTLGWYAGKIFALISTLFVLLALLFEMTALYANLARSVIRQRGAREAGQIGMDAMTASIAHEIKQPLTSIVASVVIIEDAGTGIDGKDRDRIFEPFFTTKSEGTGIGLAVCRTIIESHGGSLRASDNTPYGTVFHLALPIGNA